MIDIRVGVDDSSLYFEGPVPHIKNGNTEPVELFVDCYGSFHKAKDSLTVRFCDGTEVPVVDCRAAVPADLFYRYDFSFDVMAKFERDGAKMLEGDLKSTSWSDELIHRGTSYTALEAGKEYILKVGDVERRAVAKTGMQGGDYVKTDTYIGNPGLFVYGYSDTGEDFFVVTDVNGQSFNIVVDFNRPDLDGAVVTVREAEGELVETASSNGLTVELEPREHLLYTLQEGGKLTEKLSEKVVPNVGGADWEAAEGEPGYIANKPFSVEQEKLKLADVLTIEFTATATDDGNGNTVYAADISQYFSTLSRITTYFGDQSGPYSGMPMFYTFDGVEYELTVSDYDDRGVSFSRMFGNASLRKPDGTDTGEPMYLSVWSPSSYSHVANIYVADDKPHSVSFYVVKETVHQLDTKYIPSNVIDYNAYLEEYASETEANTAVYNAANEMLAAGKLPALLVNSDAYILSQVNYNWRLTFTSIKHSDTFVTFESKIVYFDGRIEEAYLALEAQA